MNFHSVQSKFYHSFLQTFNVSPYSFVVPSLLSSKWSVFGCGPSKLMLQVWHHVALCGQPGDHAASSCDPQQLGFKRDPNNNKRQSKNKHVNWQKVVVDTSGLSGRRHHHGELICHLSQKVTKDGGRFDQESYEKSQEAHQEIAVSYWDIKVNSSG